MTRSALSLVLLLAACVALAAPVVTVNGTTAAVTVVDVNGKPFVDVMALMQLLGGSATYDAATGKLTITSAGATTPPGGGRAPVKLADFGTAQMPGENCQLGQVYKLRTGSPLYFRLNSAEYTVRQVRFGTATVMPEAAEKFLLLHFSVQNPQKVETLVRFDSLKFTAVDEMNVNHDKRGAWGDEQTQGDLNMRLKPAQRIEAYVCLPVPARGVVPKLIVAPPLSDDGPVLRYDLRDRVQPLPAPIADPADPSGATALETVPAQPKAAYSLRNFDVTVTGFETVSTALDAAPPKAGEAYFVANLTCRNKLASEMMLRFDTFATTLTDAAGLELKRHNDLLAAGSNASFNQRVKPGAEVSVRVYFPVPKDATLRSFAIREGTSRTYEYAIPAAPGQ